MREATVYTFLELYCIKYSRSRTSFTICFSRLFPEDGIPFHFLSRSICHSLSVDKGTVKNCLSYSKNIIFSLSSKRALRRAGTLPVCLLILHFLLSLRLPFLCLLIHLTSLLGDFMDYPFFSWIPSSCFSGRQNNVLICQKPLPSIVEITRPFASC